MKKVLYSILVAFCFAFLTACSSEATGVDDSKDVVLNVNEVKLDKFNQLSYEVPELFVKEEDKDAYNSDNIVSADYFYRLDTYEYLVSEPEVCSLRLSYVNTSADYEYESLENATKKKINGVEWTIVKKVEEDKIRYEYYARHDNKVYRLYYSMYGNGKLCNQSLDIIEKNLKFEG